MGEPFVINVGRQLGSGGRIIGKELSHRFHIAFYDKELIDFASQESGLCAEFFEKADEKPSQGLLRGLWNMRFPFAASGSVTNSCLTNDALFKIQSDVIRKLADRGSCVFVGRCADYILRDYPRCVNVFISASYEDRIARLCELHDISRQKAEDMIGKADRGRAEYYNYYTGKTWGAAASYDLCIDSSALGISAATDFIAAFVKKKLENNQ